jgi:hypothetical protein
MQSEIPMPTAIFFWYVNNRNRMRVDDKPMAERQKLVSQSVELPAGQQKYS